MTKHMILATTILLATAGTAAAGGSKGSIGVGAEYQLSGLGGLSMNYDAGEFHLGGFFAFEDQAGDDNTDIALGARFFYHVHSTAMADFGIGGSFGLGIIGSTTPDDSTNTVVFIEPGFQARAFVASNVALSFTGGLTLGVADADGVAIEGQVTGIAGVHYYFF